MLTTPGDRHGGSVQTVIESGQSSHTLVEIWWVRIPAALRRYTRTLADIWQDGFYLTIWPRVTLAFPAAALLLGIMEGLTHWAPAIIPNLTNEGEAISFTELFPFMVAAAFIGALSANAGLLLVLGYALGDLVTTLGHPPSLSLATVGLPSGPQTTLLDVVAPHLVSYVLFLLLAVFPTLCSKALAVRLRVGNRELTLVLRAALASAIQGGLVFAWVLAAPLAIRVVWGWGWLLSNPPLAAMIYVETMGSVVIIAALIGGVARGATQYLSYLAAQGRRGLPYIQRIQRLQAALRSADSRAAITRRLPLSVRSIFIASVITLLLSGIIATPLEAALVFAYVALILVARNSTLPRFPPWTTWTRRITRLPLLLRLLASILATYAVAWLVITIGQGLPLLADTPTGSFQPIVIAIGLSLLVAVVLLPRYRPTGTNTPASSLPRPG
jgi:hypothetical protein